MDVNRVHREVPNGINEKLTICVPLQETIGLGGVPFGKKPKMKERAFYPTEHPLRKPCQLRRRTKTGQSAFADERVLFSFLWLFCCGNEREAMSEHRGSRSSKRFMDKAKIQSKEEIDVVGIEEIAKRNQLKLYPTSRLGQFKAHCPVCRDKARAWHLYVSANKDTYYCHKCGAKGGAIAFHAWLREIDFISAKQELYPNGTHRPVHPAERLTPVQLDEIGFSTRKLPYHAPHGRTQTEWDVYRKRALDWIWNEWVAYETQRKEQTERLMQLLADTDESHEMTSAAM